VNVGSTALTREQKQTAKQMLGSSIFRGARFDADSGYSFKKNASCMKPNEIAGRSLCRTIGLTPDST
jgi:hypothetical protein